MKRCIKTASAVLSAVIIAGTATIAAEAYCNHYNDRLACGAFAGYAFSNHTYSTIEYGVPVTKNCKVTVTKRRHTKTCQTCGISEIDNGSGCYASHEISTCGISSGSMHN